MKKYILTIAFILSVSVFGQSWAELGGRQYGNGSTVSTEVDTLSQVIGFADADNISSVYLNWFGYSVFADDTIQISTNASFSTGTIIVVLPDVPFTSQKLNIKFANELYIKRWGTDGTVNYYIAVEGN